MAGSGSRPGSRAKFAGCHSRQVKPVGETVRIDECGTADEPVKMFGGLVHADTGPALHFVAPRNAPVAGFRRNRLLIACSTV